MTIISTRLSPNELEFLAKIASENEIYKGQSKDLSLGKALYELVRWCCLNRVDIKKNNNAMNDDVKKMIEQIHVAIPNLMYLSRLQTVLASEDIPDEKLKKFRHQTVDYLNKTCGDFQSAQYNQVRFSMNDIGLKSTPTDKENTQWKLP